MRFKIGCFIFLLSLLNFSCQRQNKNSGDKVKISAINKDPYFKNVASRFGLSLSDDTMPDPGEFIFSCLQTFDTSWLLRFRKHKNVVSGTYYEVPSSYHNNINDFAIEESQLLFFNGYSFVLDSLTATIVFEKAVQILNSDTSLRDNKACRDCATYYLYYNSNFRTDNGLKFKPYYNFINNLFLEKFKQRRKPFL